MIIRKTSYDAPVITSFIFLITIAAIPVVMYLLIMVWPESLQRQIVAIVGMLLILIFGLTRQKYETLFLAILFFSQFGVSLHSFDLAQPARLQIFFNDIIIILIILVALEQEQKNKFDTIGWLFLILIVWYGVCSFFSAHPQKSLVFLLTQIKYLILYILALNIRNIPERLARRVPYIIACVIITQSIIGMAQLIHGGWIGLGILGEPTMLNTDVHFTHKVIRIAGTIGGANGFAGYIAMLLVFLFPFVLARRNILIDIGFVAGVISIVIALSRAGWLSFLLGCLSVVYMVLRARVVRISRVIVISIMGISIIVVGLSLYSDKIISRFTDPQAISSATGRISQYSEALKVIEKHIILGIGPGVTEFFGAWNEDIKYVQKALPRVYMSNQVHNAQLQVCIESGIPGLIIFLAMIGAIIWSVLFRRFNEHEPDWASLLSIGGTCAALAAMIHVSFGPELNNQDIFIAFWVLLGLSRNLTNIRILEGSPSVQKQ